jgi:hypothetical protein
MAIFGPQLFKKGQKWALSILKLMQMDVSITKKSNW